MVLGAIRPVKVYVENIKTPTESKIDSLRKESKRLTDSITMDIETFKMELDAIESEVKKNDYTNRHNKNTKRYSIFTTRYSYKK